jgi:group I intron endonuclease
MHFAVFARDHGLMLEQPVVYAIRNAENGKLYIGSSVNGAARARKHLSDLRKGIHHCVALQRAFKKYGEPAFRVEILEQCKSQEDALKAEERWLAESYGKPHCYNSTRAAISLLLDPEVRARTAAARRASAVFMAHVMATWPKMHTPEARRKRRESCKASEAFAANSALQGKNLCRPEIKAKAVAASVARRSKPVVCISSDGSERTFPSACEAARQINGGRAQSCINAACHGRAKTALGYRWRWADAFR